MVYNENTKSIRPSVSYRIFLYQLWKDKHYLVVFYHGYVHSNKEGKNLFKNHIYQVIGRNTNKIGYRLNTSKIDYITTKYKIYS